jgi:hypothetical protein
MANTASRYNLVESATLLPGSCGFCRGSRGPFIDTGLSKPMFGRFYICQDCLTDMHNQIPQPPVEEIEPEPTISREEFEEVTNDLRDTLVGPLGDLLDYLRGGSVSVLLTEDVDSDGAAEGEPERAVKSAKQANPAPVGKGPAKLSSDSVDGPNPFLDL